MKTLEDQLNMKYQGRIHDLQEKVQLLEREIKQRTYSISNNKKERSEQNFKSKVKVLNRVNSTKSMEGKKKTSLNKKYT